MDTKILLTRQSNFAVCKSSNLLATGLRTRNANATACASICHCLEACFNLILRLNSDNALDQRMKKIL